LHAYEQQLKEAGTVAGKQERKEMERAYAFEVADGERAQIGPQLRRLGRVQLVAWVRRYSIITAQS
jgi:hypothetical protein